MHAPATVEGRAVLDALDRPGAWTYAGAAGIPVGVDMQQALAALPGALDRDLARRLIPVAEGAYLGAWREHNRDSEKG